MKRRDFLKTVGYGIGGLSATTISYSCKTSSQRPNIIYILADDLGYGELGCFGQEKIRTPNIDRMAAEGMKFTQHYSGSPVCAPSRCTLLTGLHTGHCYIRDNDEMGGWGDPSKEGQRPLPADTVTIGHILKNAGYTTGVIGKWGLGGPESSGEPLHQGFDHWFGYLCQRQAHNYYPTHLWRNGKKYILEENEYFSAHQKFPEEHDPYDFDAYKQYSGKQYSVDLMTSEALEFIQTNKDKKFFLYLAYTVPHVSIQVPEDSLSEYLGTFPETPYTGDKGYLPHPAPRAGYAAMITRMDHQIGLILDLLKKLNLDENTLVIFSSDNGPTFNGGSDSEFFSSTGALRGLKCEVYEGGIRVPMIARWPGKIKAGSTTDHVSGFWDIMPTLADIARTKIPKNTDGISFKSTLFGEKNQKKHEYLYWEYHSYNGRQAVRMGDWKGIRLNVSKNREASLELYNLKSDLGEVYDVSQEHPEIVKKIAAIMNSRTPSEISKWNF